MSNFIANNSYEFNWLNPSFSFDEVIDLPVTPPSTTTTAMEVPNIAVVGHPSEIDSGSTTPHSHDTTPHSIDESVSKKTTAQLLAKAIQKVKQRSQQTLPSYADGYYQFYPISSTRPPVFNTNETTTEYVEYYENYQYYPNKRIRYEINYDETLDREYQASYETSKASVPSLPSVANTTTSVAIATTTSPSLPSPSPSSSETFSSASTKVASPPQAAMPPQAMPQVQGMSSFAHNPKAKQAFISSNPSAHPLLNIFTKICDFFNEGKFDDIQQLLDHHFHPNCMFKTRALDTEVFGTKYIMDLFRTLYDAHPDAVHTAQKCRYVVIPPKVESTSSSSSSSSNSTQPIRMITSRGYFAGTRILPSSIHDAKDLAVTSRSDGEKLHRLEDEYLFKRPNEHIVDHMDVSQLTNADVRPLLSFYSPIFFSS